MEWKYRKDGLFWQDTSKPPLPGGSAFCLMCEEPFVMPFYTGGNADQICPECAKTYADCAIVVCKKCPGRPVICRLKPGKLDNGYIVRPRAVLHTDACNICKPGLTTSRILEVSEWERTQRRHKPIVLISR